MICRICRKEVRVADIESLPLYVSGSEGLDICPQCKGKITNLVREMISIGDAAYLAGVRFGRHETFICDEKKVS